MRIERKNKFLFHFYLFKIKRDGWHGADTGQMQIDTLFFDSGETVSVPEHDSANVTVSQDLMNPVLP